MTPGLCTWEKPPCDWHMTVTGDQIRKRRSAVFQFSTLVLGKSHKASLWGKDKQEGEHQGDQL